MSPRRANWRSGFLRTTVARRILPFSAQKSCRNQPAAVEAPSRIVGGSDADSRHQDGLKVSYFQSPLHHCRSTLARSAEAAYADFSELALTDRHARLN